MPTGQPAITGEGFNWGYFIGAVGSGGGGGDGPTFPVNTGATVFHLFDVETPWVFQDYYFNMIEPVLFNFTIYSPSAPPPYNFRFRFDSAFIGSSLPPIDIYKQGLIGRVVTFDEGSTLTIDANAFTAAGQVATYGTLTSPPSYVGSYSGMHVVS